jgi:hypothetical protein
MGISDDGARRRSGMVRTRAEHMWSSHRGMQEVDKRRRNLLNDSQLAPLKNRFVIQLNESLFDSRPVAVEAHGIVVGEEGIPNLEKACLQQVRRHVLVLKQPFSKLPKRVYAVDHSVRVFKNDFASHM